MVKKLSTSIRYVIPSVLVLQVLFLIIMMFLSGNTMIDGDSARLYLHMEAIWNAKTLFVPDWIYPTTVELDCALLFALYSLRFPFTASSGTPSLPSAVQMS